MLDSLLSRCYTAVPVVVTTHGHKLRQRTPLRRAASAFMCIMLYIANLLLYVVGQVLVTLGTSGRAAFGALVIGGNGMLCMRTRNILIPNGM